MDFLREHDGREGRMTVHLQLRPLWCRVLRLPMLYWRLWRLLPGHPIVAGSLAVISLKTIDIERQPNGQKDDER